MLRANSARGERGFTLIEVLAACVMLIVGLTAALALMNAASSATSANRDREAANNLARQITEVTKRIPYTYVTPTNVSAALQSQPGMADADIIQPGWQLKAKGSDRRNQTFTITTSVCSVDDPKDNVGSHSTGTWCNNPAATTPADTSPDDYKKLTITIAPPAESHARPTSMSSFIANNRDGTSSQGGGSSGTLGEGYAIVMDPLCGGCSQGAWTNYGQVAPCKTFTATVGADKCNPTYNGAAGANYSGNSIGAVPVKAIFPQSAASVKFYLVNFPKYTLGQFPAVYPPPDDLLGNATPIGTGGREWTYTWDLADVYPNQTPDGYYNVKAVAYDASNNRIGNPLILSIWLNRFIPDLGYWTAPNAGRNCSPAASCVSSPSNYPEVEWYPKTPVVGRRDYDLYQWKVYRSGNATAVCTLSDLITGWPGGFNYAPVYGHATSGRQCQDTGAAATGTVTYTVRASSWSPDGMAETEGGNVQAASANVNAAPANGVATGRPITPASFSMTTVTISGIKYYEFTIGAYPNTSAGQFGRGDASPDCVMSFRIYRTTTAAAAPTRADRFFRTDSATTACSPPGVGTFRVPVTGTPVLLTAGQQSRWWITGVDKQLNESGFRGPLTFTNP